MFCYSRLQNIKTDRKYKSVLGLAPGYDDILTLTLSSCVWNFVVILWTLLTSETLACSLQSTSHWHTHTWWSAPDAWCTPGWSGGRGWSPRTRPCPCTLQRGDNSNIWAESDLVTSISWRENKPAGSQNEQSEEKRWDPAENFIRRQVVKVHEVPGRPETVCQ